MRYRARLDEFLFLTLVKKVYVCQYVALISIFKLLIYSQGSRLVCLQLYLLISLHYSRICPALQYSLSLFRYRVALPIDNVVRSLGYTGPEAMSDWNVFSAHMGLTYTDTSRDNLDCKTSMAALPLQAKPS